MFRTGWMKAWVLVCGLAIWTSALPCVAQPASERVAVLHVLGDAPEPIKRGYQSKLIESLKLLKKAPTLVSPECGDGDDACVLRYLQDNRFGLYAQLTVWKAKKKGAETTIYLTLRDATSIYPLGTIFVEQKCVPSRCDAVLAELVTEGMAVWPERLGTTVRIEGDQGAPVAKGADVLGTVPFEQTFARGRHVLRVGGGETDRRLIEFVAGKERSLLFRVGDGKHTQNAETSTPRQSSGRTKRRTLIVSGSVLTAVGLGMSAYAIRNYVVSQCSRRGVGGGCIDRDQVTASNHVWMALGVAAIGAGAGLVIRGVRLTPMVDAKTGSAFLSLSGKF